MTIDWNAFTPGAALAGGALIGLAAAMFILLSGRIAGISGVLGGLVWPKRGDIDWRIAFIAGLVLAPLIFTPLMGARVGAIAASPALVIAGGLLVGIGTRYGAGCTSGHGVCGLSRLSPRSLVATLAFMAAGFATVFVLRHLLGGAA
jgi:uncharacterized protein